MIAWNGASSSFVRGWAHWRCRKAGLLNGNPQNAQLCDAHPSLTGQRLLAKTVEATYLAARRD